MATLAALVKLTSTLMTIFLDPIRAANLALFLGMGELGRNVRPTIAENHEKKPDTFYLQAMFGKI